MKKKNTILILIFLFTSSALAQDLLSERIWKITGRKRSIFFEQGIFHNGKDDQVKKSSLDKVRHSYSKQKKRERIVFDFNTAKVPRLYGHLSKDKKKVYVDFFSTGINPKIGAFGTGHFIKKIDLYPVTEKLLSAELSFDAAATMEVFYLENPGRLVLDIKK